MLVRGRFLFRSGTFDSVGASSVVVSFPNFCKQKQFASPCVCYCSRSHSKSNKQTVWWPWLTFGGLLAGFATFKLNSKNSISAYAAEIDSRSPFIGSNSRRAGGSSKRGSFNFVADVVDVVGNAVVYIERLGKLVIFYWQLLFCRMRLNLDWLASILMTSFANQDLLRSE